MLHQLAVEADSTPDALQMGVGRGIVEGICEDYSEERRRVKTCGCMWRRVEERRRVEGGLFCSADVDGQLRWPINGGFR